MRFLTRQGVDATTSSDAGHQKQNRRWKTEDGGWKPVRRHKSRPFSILHPRFLLLLALAIFLAGCGPPGPRALLKGEKLLSNGDYSGAVAELKTATSLMSTNAQAWNYLGVAYQHAGQPADAALAYQRALTLDRDLVEAHYNLGCLWLEQNKPDVAKTEFTAYVLRRSKDPEGWTKLGMAQLRLRDLPAAEKSFNTALAIDARRRRGFEWPWPGPDAAGPSARRVTVFRRRQTGTTGLCAGAVEPGDGGAAVFARQRAGVAKLPRVSRVDPASGGLGAGECHRR